MKQRVLVTGGAGFLGSHLCERLLADGNEVICLDNFSTGKKANILHLVRNPYFDWVLHDVIVPYQIEVDQIYNLACSASPVHYQSDPIHTMKTNLYGSVNLLELAQRMGARIFQASTSEVYGDPEVHPQTEDYWGHVNPIGIRSCYDEGKRSAEALFFDYHRQNGVDIRVVRLFNTYGPRMHPNDGRVVSNFIIQALRGEDITVLGTGGQTRSFCYVDDTIEAMVRMMNQDGLIGPVNIGNPVELSMLALAEQIILLTDSKSKLVFKPLVQDDPKQRLPDISLAQEKLGGWYPRVPLEEGLKRTIEYLREAL